MSGKRSLRGNECRDKGMASRNPTLLLFGREDGFRREE